MDTYPGDLLAGVFPLVFAVDAILPSDTTSTESSDENDKVPTKDEDAEIEQSSSTRSLFDRFLDAISIATNTEEEQDSAGKQMNRAGSETLASLLRGDDKDESSDEEDDRSQDSSRRNAFRRNSPMSSFRGSKKHASGTSATFTSTAYARVLSLESFFQRARILSISTKHGFPPSKDPEGSQNRTLVLAQTKSHMSQGATFANALRLKNIVENQLADGILPAGWLEKHVHALPSVLVVVTTLCANGNGKPQEAQDQHLLETMEHLKYNLASKRDCHIHIVCLVNDSPSPSVLTTDAWLTFVKYHTELPSTSISLLSVKDLASDMATLSPSLRDLHATIRDASFVYYLQQARRNKHKHNALGYEQQPSLLPLATRYCFKIGVFYEFQLRHEKSLKYFALAYRHVQSYYQFLLSGSPVNVEMRNPQDEMQVETNDDVTTGIEVSLADASDEEEEEEEAPTAMSQEEELKRVVSQEEQVTSDLAHQCRAVADWLNFKLLKAAFDATNLGAKDEGLVAASWQWRKHAQVMLRETDEDPSNPAWNFWAYVAHQRLVMSQLVERHPPTDAAVPEEVLIRCSPWRNYLAAAEAELMLGVEIRKEESVDAALAKQGGQSMRQRFVGDMDSEGLSPKLQELLQQDHTEKALQLVLHAIELFEQESKALAEELENEESEANKPFLPSGSRLYYVAGGLLLGMKRYQDAIPYLKKSLNACTKREGIELSIEKMLFECYRNYIPPPSSDSPEEEKDSKMLETLFHPGLLLSEVQPVLEKYSSLRESDNLKWNVESTDDSDMSLPFSFSVTFPSSTHATAGDIVTAIVTIKSNLPYPVLIQAVSLKSAPGKILVPLENLLNAQNAEKRNEGGIIMSPLSAVWFSTNIVLPRDLDKLPSDEGSSNSAVPSARPRTAGVSSAAGARLVSEDRYGSEESNGQWNKALLGGKPLVCDGMSLQFAPVCEGNIPFISLTIKKSKPMSVAPPKRTPFEVNSYIEEAWARPEYVPLTQGPKCLRVLGPMPHMTVTNLTDTVVNGKALEGTVNRFLFQLKAGATESCFDIEYSVTVATTIVTTDGTTAEDVNPEDGVSPSTEVDMAKVVTGKRTPVIVSPDGAGIGHRSTGFGYDLPPGWRLEGTGHASDKVMHHVRNLQAGDSTYICFEMYRPSRTLKPLENPYDSERTNVDENNQDEVCQTDFDISISYRQSRPAIQKAGEEESQKELSDSVVLEHHGSVLWESPLVADFSLDGRSQRAFPSGSRHPSNYISSTETANSGSSGASPELALINLERTSARCVLRSKVADDGLGIELSRIGFEEKDIALDKGETACELHLQSGGNSATPGVLFESKNNDPSRILADGSKFGLTYLVQPVMKEKYLKGSISARLGVIWVDWHPVSIPLPEDISHGAADMKRLDSHGPLRLKEPATLKFRGPPCYIENSPFETVLESLPPSPRVATPFEMTYRISNKTAMQQKVSVLMSDLSSDETRERGSISEGVLVSGLIHGEITLAPFETQTLSYTALATKAGKTTMPALSISSDRYKTWLIKDQQQGSREIFVMP